MQPMIAATSGKLVVWSTVYTWPFGHPCCAVLPLEEAISSPITTNSPASASPKQASQTLGCRESGNAQTTNNKLGTTTDSQIKCIETNASVAGSQHSSIGGILTPANKTAPYTDAPTNAMVANNFVRNCMELPSCDLNDF
ncbi:MAG: hypothetical protein ACI87E_004931 [Mariniblastus sp.]|jgi:hypothetical protein